MDNREKTQKFIETIKHLTSKDSKFNMDTVISMYEISNNAPFIMKKIGAIDNPSRGVYKWKANGKTIDQLTDEFINYRDNMLRKYKPVNETPLMALLQEMKEKIDFIYSELKK